MSETTKVSYYLQCYRVPKKHPRWLGRKFLNHLASMGTAPGPDFTVPKGANHRGIPGSNQSMRILYDCDPGPGAGPNIKFSNQKKISNHPISPEDRSTEPLPPIIMASSVEDGPQTKKIQQAHVPLLAMWKETST